MRGRLVEINQKGRYLSVERGFLCVSADHQTLARIDLDTVCAVIISGQGVTLTSNCIARCGARLIPIICCGPDYKELSVCLPSVWNFHQMQRQLAQAKATEAIKARLWQQIVQQKILNQAEVLRRCQSTAYTRLNRLAKQVKGADKELVEGQAAAVYWRALFGTGFKRRRKEGGPNALLNYGYAVLRGAMIRAVLSAGLNPSFPIQHHNQSNPCCLIDDLMEPYRPILDYLVIQLLDRGLESLTPTIKKCLAGLLVGDLSNTLEVSPIFQHMYYCSYSLWQTLNGEAKKLTLPDLPHKQAYEKILKVLP